MVVSGDCSATKGGRDEWSWSCLTALTKSEICRRS